MKQKNKFLPVIVMVIFILSMAGCDTLQQAGLIEGQQSGMRASGSVEATSVLVSSEQGGKVREVYAAEGDRVAAGDALFRLQDDILAAQRDQAETALAAAEAGLLLAQAGVDAAAVALEMAELQHEIALEEARQQARTGEEADWERDQPDAFNLPAWYFLQDERIEAAREEMETAEEELEDEEESLVQLQGSTAFNDLQEAENRLANAQAAYQVAELVQERASAQAQEDLRDFAEQNFEAAETELEAAQSAYDQLLTEADSQEVLEARARVAVAQERYEIARDAYQALLTGEHARPVMLAALGVEQAQAAFSQAQAQVTQAQTLVAQAQAELDLIDIYLEKLTIYAPTAGVVRSRNIEPGEVLQPGVAALVIDQLENLTLTVYFPEDQYGQIALGDLAEIHADSFPNETFTGTVVRIADRAEYTPRNVQTQEERVTTVYAVEISIQNPEGKLKPGMPADALFDQ